jgi:Concanavalin A-like lectin/glucanases superfamily
LVAGGDNNALDMLGNLPGTLQNGVDANCAGIVGNNGFCFNGNSQAVEIPYSPILITPQYSVEAWVNPASQVNDPISQNAIFGQGYGQCQLLVRAGSVGLSVAFAFATDPRTWYEVDSVATPGTGSEIPIGYPTHLVGTWDGAPSASTSTAS